MPGHATMRCCRADCWGGAWQAAPPSVPAIGSRQRRFRVLPAHAQDRAAGRTIGIVVDALDLGALPGIEHEPLPDPATLGDVNVLVEKPDDIRRRHLMIAPLANELGRVSCGRIDANPIGADDCLLAREPGSRSLQRMLAVKTPGHRDPSRGRSGPSTLLSGCWPRPGNEVRCYGRKFIPSSR